MKQSFGIVFALVTTLVSMILWGRVFVLAMLHPIRAFERIGLPILAVILLFWLFARFRGDHKTGLNAHVAKAIREKNTKELLEISVNDSGTWSETAVSTARAALKNRSTASIVDGIAELKS